MRKCKILYYQDTDHETRTPNAVQLTQCCSFMILKLTVIAVTHPLNQEDRSIFYQIRECLIYESSKHEPILTPSVTRAVSHLPSLLTTDAQLQHVHRGSRKTHTDETTAIYSQPASVSLTSTAKQSTSTEGNPQSPFQQNSSKGAAIFERLLSDFSPGSTALYGCYQQLSVMFTFRCTVG